MPFIILFYKRPNGGKLFDKLHENGDFNEATAASIVFEICSAIEYLHSLNIAYKNLSVCFLNTIVFYFLSLKVAIQTLQNFEDSTFSVKIHDLGEWEICEEESVEHRGQTINSNFIGKKIIFL